MPNITSAKKHLRQTKKRTAHNRKYKNRIKNLSKIINGFIQENNAQKAKEQLPLLFKAIDKAAKRNILHKNTAARRKSLVARRVSHIETTAKENSSQAK